jgi:hypothetical protein
MNSKKNIQDELNELNSKLSVNNQDQVYNVPDGYFDGFAASVMARIQVEENFASPAEEIGKLSPLLSGISRIMPYWVPDTYFEDNIASLPAFTSESEESLILSFIEKEMPYEVPMGYFASFPETVVEKMNNRAKVVPLKRKRWMHMAAAAVVAGIIIFSGLAYFKTGTPVKDPVAVEIKKASTEELNAFVKSTDPSLDEHSTAQNTLEVKHLLKDVSDKELEAFLKQIPTEDGDDFDIN